MLQCSNGEGQKLLCSIPLFRKKQVFLALFGRFLTLINAKEPFLALLGEKN